MEAKKKDEHGIIIDERRIIVKMPDGKVRMYWSQVQEYTEEQVQHMLASFQKTIDDNSAWIGNFDTTLQQAREVAQVELDKMKRTLEADNASAQEGIEMWQNPVDYEHFDPKPDSDDGPSA